MPSILIIAAALLMMAHGCGSSVVTGAQDLQFTKEGELTFISAAAAQPIVEIDIEIADTPQERVQGLKHRHFLPANAGMLFIFDSCQPLTFWMQDTLISLDIIFADDAQAIVHIERSTTPLSEAPISSRQDAMYVVEVNAGFCDLHGIAVGDAITFTRLAPTLAGE